MSAFGFDDDQLDDLTKAIRERLDRLPLHPHQRLPYPPMLKGKDVTAQRLITETLEQLKRRNVQ